MKTLVFTLQRGGERKSHLQWERIELILGSQFTRHWEVPEETKTQYFYAMADGVLINNINIERLWIECCDGLHYYEETYEEARWL